MASDAGAAVATSTTVVARTAAGRRGEGGFPRPARLEQAAPGHPRGAGRGAGPADAVVGPHVALGRVAPSRRAAPAGRAPAGRGGRRSRSAWPGPAATFRTTCCRMGLDPGTSAVTSDEHVAHAAGADHAGGVDLGGGEALPGGRRWWRRGSAGRRYRGRGRRAGASRRRRARGGRGRPPGGPQRRRYRAAAGRLRERW